MGQPRPIFIFILFNYKLTEKCRLQQNLSMDRQVEGKYDDHLTTTTKKITTNKCEKGSL